MYVSLGGCLVREALPSPTDSVGGVKLNGRIALEHQHTANQGRPPLSPRTCQYLCVVRRTAPTNTLPPPCGSVCRPYPPCSLQHHWPLGECLPGACPARYLCIKYLAPSLSSPREVPQVDRTRPQTFPASRCISRNMRIQQHKMSLPPLPTTTLAIVINWVQRMGQILRHGEKVLQIVW